MPEMVWVPDTQWKLLSGNDRKRCRMTGCYAPAVAALLRTSHFKNGKVLGRWWNYWHNHLYGRQIEGGRVLVQVCADSITAQRGYAGDGPPPVPQ